MDFARAKRFLISTIVACCAFTPLVRAQSPPGTPSRAPSAIDLKNALERARDNSQQLQSATIDVNLAAGGSHPGQGGAPAVAELLQPVHLHAGKRHRIRDFRRATTACTSTTARPRYIRSCFRRKDWRNIGARSRRNRWRRRSGTSWSAVWWPPWFRITMLRWPRSGSPSIPSEPWKKPSASSTSP